MTLKPEHNSILNTLIPQLMIMAMGDRLYVGGFLEPYFNKWGGGTLGQVATDVLHSLQELCNEIQGIQASARGGLDEKHEDNFDHKLKIIKASVILETIPEDKVKSLKELTRNYIARNVSFFPQERPKDLQEFMAYARIKNGAAPFKNKKQTFELQTNLRIFFDALEKFGSFSNVNDILLFGACIAGNVEIAEQLIEANTHIHESVPGFTNFETPLHIASRYGHTAIVKLLLKKGVNVNLEHCGDTPLHRAVKYSQYEVIDTLTDALEINLNVMNRSHQTPLKMAAEQHNLLSAVLLLKSPDQFHQARAVFTLHWLARNNVWQLLCLLYKKCNLIPEDVTSWEDGLTALHAAILSNNINMVKYIVDLPGIRFDLESDCRRGPLEYAINEDVDNEIVALLAKKTPPELMPKKLDLVERAILTQNFAMLRVIENQMPRLLPRIYYKSSNDRVNYLAIIKSMLSEFPEFEKIWNEKTTLKDAFQGLINDFVGKHKIIPNLNWDDKAQHFVKLDSPALISEVVAWYSSFKEEIPINHTYDIHLNFSKLLKFFVFKCKFVQTFSHMNVTAKDSDALALLLSQGDRIISANVQQSARLYPTNLKNEKELNSTDNNNNNNNNNTPIPRPFY
ncbi:MAG: ankyrin repeat domain-containing protein [Gammaproteobacteria bacterium]|nr:ankyrin repeat domain-containing protein [Gammaproteobacteria bacterium]